ncbi:hypothetical protein FRB93_011725 [Tulasnella sp. JGI-2019a]|nr:hypothetical protein FRB93_011725 [Tulasnella sp. JGI-2019a]
MTSAKTATHHQSNSPPHLKAFSRLASFFSTSNRHHHAPPSPSPSYHAPPSPTPSSNNNMKHVNSPLTQYLFSPNPFAARASQVDARPSPQVDWTEKTISQQPGQQPSSFSTFSSYSSRNIVNNSLNANANPQMVQVPGHPYTLNDTPILVMDPLVTLKGKARAAVGVGGGGTTGTGNNNKDTAFIFPTQPTTSFNAAPAGGIGESPQSPVVTSSSKAMAGAKGSSPYVPFSVREHLPHHTLKNSSTHVEREPGSPTSPQIGPATAVRTSLLGFGTGGTQMGAGGFAQNPRRAPQPPTSSSGIGLGTLPPPPPPGSATTGTNVPTSGAWSGIMPSSATSDGSAGATGFQNWEASGTGQQVEARGAGSWGRMNGHGKKLSGGAGGIVGLSPWTEREEETPTTTKSKTDPLPSLLRRRAATTDSKQTSPFLGEFNAVVREGELLAAQQQQPSSAAAPFDRRYHVVVTPPPPPIAGPSSQPYPPPPTLSHSRSQPGNMMMSGPGSSSSHYNKPPIPPKSMSTLRAINRTATLRTLRGSTSTPNLADHSHQYSQQHHGAGWKGKGREVVLPASVPPHQGYQSQTIQTRSSRSNSARSHYATDGLRPPATHGTTGGPGYGYPLTPAPSRGNILQAQTICDAFMFPKPRFVAHLISPPESPVDMVHPPPSVPDEDQNQNQLAASSNHPPWMLSPPPSPLNLEKVVKEGIERDRERDQWATKASKGLLSRGPSFRTGNTTSGGLTSEGGGTLVNRLRSRTLSGMKSSHHGHGHGRGDSRDTNTYTNTNASSGRPSTGGRAPARVMSPGPGGLVHFMGGSSSKAVKNKRSLDFLMAEKAAGMKLTMPGGGDESQPPPQKPIPPGKAGRLSLTSSNGTGADPNGRPGSRSRYHNYYAPTATSAAAHSNASRTHTRTGSGSQDATAAGSRSVASYAIRKVRSLCGPDLLSPALETPSMVGVSHQRSVRKGEPIQKSFDYRFDDEQGGGGEIVPGRRGSPDDGVGGFDGTDQYRYSAAVSQGGRSRTNSQANTYSQYGGTDTAENADIQEVRRVSVLGPTPFRASTPIGALDIPGKTSPLPRRSGPTPTPSPTPSSYTGVYGIAVGTPLNHPYSLPDGQDDYPPVPLPAGPHRTSPTTAFDPNVTHGEMFNRHRLPPHKSPPCVAEARPVLHAHEQTTVADTSQVEEEELDSPVENLHPFAASRTPVARNIRASMNSIDAMLNGEMIEASHTVSPLGVREAGDRWVNSNDAELGPDYDREDYSHSEDSGLGSSTKIPSHREGVAQILNRARSKSDATMLVESAPPSMYPSFNQERSVSNVPFDTRTFGDDTSVMQSLFTAPEIPQDNTDLKHSTSASSLSTTTSSRISPPPPLGGGSSDDFESFQDLFYVPRSRQPSSASPRFLDSSISDAISERSLDPDLMTSIGGNDGRIRLPAAHLMSPLSSVVHRSQSEPSSSPYHVPFMCPPHRGEEHTSYFPTQHTTIYDTIEEEEISHSARTSVEHMVDEELRLGAVRVRAPNMSTSDAASRRQSTHLSLVECHDGNAEDEEYAPLGDLPDIITRRSRYVDSPQTSSGNFRNSYLTTGSGESGIRMSISDFPPPPRNDNAILEYYGVSPFATPAGERTDPLSFTISTDGLKRPILPRRSDTFGL